MKKILTSESVNIGHPDKTCDIMADAFLDEAFRQDPKDLDAINEFLDYLCMRSLDLKSKRNCARDITHTIERDKWFKIYDAIEKYIEIRIKNDTFKSYDPVYIIDEVNRVLKEENYVYRMNYNCAFVAITDKEEMEEVEKIIDTSPYDAVKIHMGKALRLLSIRENPDYENSIKESITAVESLCCNLTGNNKATLGDALKVLERERKIHGAMKEAFLKL